MKRQFDYEEELREISRALKKCFKDKYSFINELKIMHYIRKTMKLNKRTRNEHIDELMYFIGRTKKEYKKHCHRNNYYTNPEMNKKIKEAFIKLSRKSMKIKTKRSTVKQSGNNLRIEYNSNRGSYKIIRLQKNGIEKIRYYKIKSIKNIARKREKVLENLKKINYGINVFDELGVDENSSYKLNPDIIHILIKEGKIDYAKMYIKDVLDETTIIYKPFKIKYELNKDLSKGIFSREENKIMKKMARYDAVATDLVFIDSKKKRRIARPKVNVLETVKRYICLESKTKVNDYVFDISKVQRIIDMKRRKEEQRVQSPALYINSNIRKMVENIKMTNNNKNVGLQYERKIV